MCGSGFSPTSFPARRLASRRYTGSVSCDSRLPRPDRRGLRRHQRGWVGLVVILLALVIVAWLAKSALTSYGLTGKPPAAAPGAPPTDPRERARAVEQTVIDRARESARQVDEAEKPQ